MSKFFEHTPFPICQIKLIGIRIFLLKLLFKIILKKLFKLCVFCNQKLYPDFVFSLILKSRMAIVIRKHTNAITKDFYDSCFLTSEEES